jgi:hypothetical protein
MKEKMNMIERREGFFIFIVDVRKKKKEKHGHLSLYSSISLEFFNA